MNKDGTLKHITSKQMRIQIADLFEHMIWERVILVSMRNYLFFSSNNHKLNKRTNRNFIFFSLFFYLLKFVYYLETIIICNLFETLRYFYQWVGSNKAFKHFHIHTFFLLWLVLE